MIYIRMMYACLCTHVCVWLLCVCEYMCLWVYVHVCVYLRTRLYIVFTKSWSCTLKTHIVCNWWTSFTVLFIIVLLCTVLYIIVLLCTVLYSVVLLWTVLYSIVQLWTILYIIVLLCTVLYSIALLIRSGTGSRTDGNETGRRRQKTGGSTWASWASNKHCFINIHEYMKWKIGPGTGHCLMVFI